jgi:formylglycine-generating enzyme required for sulfatase activity
VSKNSLSTKQKLALSLGFALVLILLVGVFYFLNQGNPATNDLVLPTELVFITSPTADLSQSAAPTHTADAATLDAQAAIEQTQSQAQAFIDSWTATPSPTPTATPTLTPLEQAILRAETGVATNAEWEAFYPDGFVQEFNGVEMLLVPKGCFMMGSTDKQVRYGYEWGGDMRMERERSAHEICLDEPYWIDQTEVTQGDFERLGGIAEQDSEFSGENRPVERINWFEARDFCILRGGRLPTEAEWEYAARGVDALIFPWGNEFAVEHAVPWTYSGGQTADVGSYPSGASWIGAQDMSSNVFEWTNSLFMPYPYVPDDGRESPVDGTNFRIVRGGSWNTAYAYPRRSAFRETIKPIYKYSIVGLRCLRELHSPES